MAGGGSQAAVNLLTNVAKAAASLGLGATLLSSSLYTVDGGQRAVLFDRFRGVLDETVGEGTHFRVPWLQTPYIFDIRTRPHTFTSNSGTKDLQMVNLTLRLISRPDVSQLPTIFKSLGTEYDEKSLVIAVLVIAMTIFSTGIDSKCFQFYKTEAEPDDVPYGSGFFHFVFAMGAMYFAMLLVGWRDHNVMQKWTIDVGWVSMWVRIVNECLAAIIYIWMLVAPLVWKRRRAKFV